MRIFIFILGPIPAIFYCVGIVALYVVVVFDVLGKSAFKQVWRGEMSRKEME